MVSQEPTHMYMPCVAVPVIQGSLTSSQEVLEDLVLNSHTGWWRGEPDVLF